MQLVRIGDPNYRTADLVAYTTVLIVLAVLITVAVGHTWRYRTIAMAYAVPLAAAGHLLMIATVFGNW